MLKEVEQLAEGMLVEALRVTQVPKPFTKALASQ